MYLPKWLLILLLVFLAGLTAERLVSQPREVQVPVGIILRDGENRPIRPASGVTISVFRVGRRPLPKSDWPVVRGRPDGEGYLRTDVRVVVESTLKPVVSRLLQ